MEKGQPANHLEEVVGSLRGGNGEKLAVILKNSKTEAIN